MDAKRNRGWWLTRIELALGIVAGAALLAFIVLVALPGLLEPMFGGGHGNLGTGILIASAGVLGTLVGLAWMIRIFRDTRDEPPRWRYRERAPMDAKHTRGWRLTRIELALGIVLVLVACAIAYVVLAFYVGLPPRRLVRAVIGLMPYVGLLVVLIALVASMLAISGRPAFPPRAERTRGWYLTRIELAIAVGAPVLLAVLLFIAAPQGMGGHFGDPLPEALLIPAVGVVGVLFGLAWMIRIFRGPRDEPPPWRYRDR